jgi:hypothetical protein
MVMEEMPTQWAAMVEVSRSGVKIECLGIQYNRAIHQFTTVDGNKL